MLQRLRQHSWQISGLKDRVWLRGLASGHSTTVNISNKPVTLSVGQLAHLADGSVLIESGETAVFATAVSSQLLAANPSSGLPLMVQYRERSDAARRIPHNFLRRDLRVTEKEVLSSRLIDRSLRPLFPKGYFHDTQIMCNLLSLDKEGDPEVMALNGAAAALVMSNIPWANPVGAARVCAVGDRLTVNPPREMLSDRNLKLNLVVACHQTGIVMVEGSGKEVSEDVICEAVSLAAKDVQPFLEALLEFQAKHGKKKREFKAFLPSEELDATIERECRERVMCVLQNTSHSKTTRDLELFQIRDKVKEKLTEEDGGLVVNYSMVNNAFWDICRKCMAELVLDQQMRCDGRGFDDLRSIDCGVDTFPALHGSSLFRRGETQVLCTITFDSLEAAAKADAITKLLGGEMSRKFMVHYEFPPFATNSISSTLYPDRREVGHGALAQRALQPVIPNDFPFTIRLTSQVLASNGSSSIATVCGGSLALFDAGVPISRTVGGVACGLITRCGSGDDRGEVTQHRVLTDLLGIEDALGNMDFKVAGTREGVTFMQSQLCTHLNVAGMEGTIHIGECDIKGLNGLSMSIFEESLCKAKDGRMKVLDCMDATQASPRSEMKENHPAYETIEVPLPKRSRIIGAGGHRIKALIEETGAAVQTVGDHHMSIFTPTQDVMENVKTRVENLMNVEQDVELDFGKTYTGKIVEIRDYGAVVELEVPGVAVSPSVLLHVSQMDHKPVRHPHAIGLTEGDYIQVKYYGRDPITGRARISRKSLLPLPEPASSIPDNNTGLLDEAEEKRQRSPYSRSRPLQRQNKFERPAFERPGPRPPRYRHSPEGHWSQREGRQAQSHQQRSGYNPKWRTKY